MNALTIDSHSISQDTFNDTTWLRYFDIQQALENFYDYLRGLPSNKTPEKHTQRDYVAGLKYFLEWAGFPHMKLPTKELVEKYIAHLLNDKEWYRGNISHYGISTKSVANRYLSPLRLFLKKLQHQYIPVTGAEREFINDCKDHIARALDVKNPKEDTKTDIAPLWNPKFKRLHVNQVNTVLNSFDRTSIAGARDYALLFVAFTTGLRVAEIQRITLNNFSMEGDHVLITVRGKGRKIDPVVLDKIGYQAIKHYIALYNEPLDEDDPRRIRDDNPVFQPMRKGDNHPEVDGIYDSNKGISKAWIGQIIKRRTRDALGEDYECSAHDCRRTFASIAYINGMELPEIQTAMRHSNPAITLAYVGTRPNYDNTLLTNYVKIQ